MLLFIVMNLSEMMFGELSDGIVTIIQFVSFIELMIEVTITVALVMMLIASVIEGYVENKKKKNK